VCASPPSGGERQALVETLDYFHLQGRLTALPCNTFNSTEDNIAAIAGFIAQRRQARYGVGTVEQMLMGFQAIGGPREKPWRETLGIRPVQRVDPTTIGQRVTELAKRHHPDVVGGSHERMSEINDVVTSAMAEVTA
jgi:hypothetical protein